MKSRLQCIFPLSYGNADESDVPQVVQDDLADLFVLVVVVLQRLAHGGQAVHGLVQRCQAEESIFIPSFPASVAHPLT